MIGLIGKKLSHSLSPDIHKTFGNKSYTLKEIDEQNVVNFIKKREWLGLNVTIPYKQTVIDCADYLDDVAKEIGAVNTLVRVDGKIFAYNTDVEGMRYALDKVGILLDNKSVLILGSGGTSKTAQYLCKRAKVVRVVSRTGGINYDNCYEYQDVEIIINTTPVGMYPDSFNSPIDLSKFANLEGVMDCVYNPINTYFSQQATLLGCKVAKGIDMLLEQARLSHNLFCKANVKLEEVDKIVCNEIVKNIVEKSRNIYLVGMGGAGKSTLAKLLSKKLGREIVDSDQEIVESENMSIEGIISTHGENCFREIEKNVIKDIALKRGIIVACGGGVVLDEENVKAMRTNGIIVLINREEILLRPLYPTKDMAQAVYGKRKPIYQKACDITVDNNGNINDTIDEILQKIGKL